MPLWSLNLVTDGLKIGSLQHRICGISDRIWLWGGKLKQEYSYVSLKKSEILFWTRCLPNQVYSKHPFSSTMVFCFINGYFRNSSISFFYTFYEVRAPESYTTDTVRYLKKPCFVQDRGQLKKWVYNSHYSFWHFLWNRSLKFLNF